MSLGLGSCSSLVVVYAKICNKIVNKQIPNK